MNGISRSRGFVYAALAGVLWGITGPLGQYLFDDKEIVPEWLVPYRLLCAGGILLIWLSVTERNEVARIWKNKKDALHLIVYSVAGMMTVQYSFFVAVEASNGGTATVLQYLNPAMMIVFLAAVKKKIPKEREVAAVLIALLGVFLLSTNGNIHSLVITPKGLFYGILCAVFTCIYSMLPGRLLEVYDSRVICGYAMLIGGIFLTAWKRPWTLGIHADGIVWILFVLLVTAGTILPFVFSLRSIPVIGPVCTNLLASVEPVVASLVTWAVLGTEFGRIEMLGFVCIIATIVILAAGDGKVKDKAKIEDKAKIKVRTGEVYEHGRE